MEKCDLVGRYIVPRSKEAREYLSIHYDGSDDTLGVKNYPFFLDQVDILFELRKAGLIESRDYSVVEILPKGGEP